MYDEFLGLGYDPDFERYTFNRASIPVGDISPQELEGIHHGLVAEFQRKVTRPTSASPLEMLRSINSWRDVRHLVGSCFGGLAWPRAKERDA